LLINGVNSDTTDTVRFGTGSYDHGYTLERTGATNTPTTFTLHTTLEGLNKFSFPDSLLRADNATNNIVRAKLVFYEAQEELSQSLPANHQRLSVSSLKLHPATDIEPVYEYQFIPTNLPVFKAEDSPTFEVDVTAYINNVVFGSLSGEDLVLGIGSSSGIIRSTLLYGVTAPEDIRPKLIITSLVD
jgi:hypothetical protein